MMFQAYVEYAEWAFFKEPEPTVSDELRTQMVDADGQPTAALSALIIATNIKHEKWKNNNDQINLEIKSKEMK